MNGKEGKHGKDGKDLHFEVPLGTSIYQIKASSQEGYFSSKN